MKKKRYLSVCCDAPVITVGGSDSFDSGSGVTLYFVCSKCGEPCNVYEVKDEVVFSPDFDINKEK